MITPTRNLERFQDAARRCEVDLSDNTNLWGPPPSLQRAASAFAARDVSRYPSAFSDDLKQAIARYTDVDESCVVTGCGSDDVLDSAIRAFGVAGDGLAQLDPTFSMIRAFSALNGLSVSGISADEENLAEAFLKTGARLIYLCSPNNPTGGVISPEVVEAIVAGSNGIVIIDEAYIDFGGASSLPLLERYDNVLVTRTFSKAFGLAGFRIGYGVGAPELIRQVECARGPYKVSALSERVAIDALENDIDWVTQRAAEAVANRERLCRELAALENPALPSGANFVLVPVGHAERVEAFMLDAGVAVRRFDRLPGIGDAVRITVGPWPLMEKCLDAFRGAVS
jgi:histidinol-phosphate aminotransferase